MKTTADLLVQLAATRAADERARFLRAIGRAR